MLLEFGCCALHDARNAGVVYMADFGEKVVFHLKIQAPDVPRQQAIVARKVDGGVHNAGAMRAQRVGDVLNVDCVDKL